MLRLFCSKSFDDLWYEIVRLRTQPARFAIAALVAVSALLIIFASRWILASASASVFALAIIGVTVLLGAAAGSCAAALSSLLLWIWLVDGPFNRAVADARVLRAAIGFTGLVVFTHFIDRRYYAIRRARERPRLGFQGFLDGAENGVISGWAVDADRPSQPVVVSIFVDDQLAAEAAAVHQRQDVATTLASSGCHGFRCELQEQLASRDQFIINVCYPNGVRLPNSPILFTKPRQYHGYLDGVEEGVVSGWALNSNRPSQPVLVSVFVNNQPAIQVAAVHYRPDVAATLACSGRYGFYLDVREQLYQSGDVLVKACFPDGTCLPHSPCYFASSSGPGRRPNTVLFMHIPKTAGTAFREAIAANFRLSEIAYIYPTAPGFLVKDLRELPMKQRCKFRIVIGHFQFGMHFALPQQSEYVTIVREPAARVLSQYHYLGEHQPELVSDARGRLLPLEKVFESRLSVDFDNAMVRCFSGVDQDVFPPGALTDEIYETALYNLRNAFTFVGHQEEAGKAYGWLCDHFSWTSVSELPFSNRGERGQSPSLPNSTLQAIQHFNKWDFRLYEEICRLFPRNAIGQKA